MTRFQRIDATHIAQHSFLTLEDECYFLFEYTSKMGFSFSATNNLISNLKKKPSESHRPGYHYKARAIRECSAALGPAINSKWLAEGGVLVPVPPSKAKGDPDYDERMLSICRGIVAPTKVDVRELVTQSESIAAAHESADGERPSVEQYLAIYSIAEEAATPTPTAIAVVDDVLTRGTHFRAMKLVLQARFPGVPVVGFFIARRVFPEVDFSALFSPVGAV